MMAPSDRDEASHQIAHHVMQKRVGAKAKVDEVALLADKYHDVRSAQRAIDLGWTAAQIELRDLGLAPQESVVLQRLASRLLLTDPVSMLKVKTPVDQVSEFTMDLTAVPRQRAPRGGGELRGDTGVLLPGTYDIEIQASGYASVDRPRVIIVKAPNREEQKLLARVLSTGQPEEGGGAAPR